MKFRDPKTGEVFNSMYQLARQFCRERDCDGKCPIDAPSGGHNCWSWAAEHPAEAARLMGLEVVEDKEEPMEKTDKPRIDWEKIQTGAAVWCRTEEEAKYLLDEGDRRGYKWFSGRPLTGHTNWNEHKENTVYCDFDGTGVVFSDKTCTDRTVIPFEHLITPDRPRICEVLGGKDNPLEVGERFSIDGYPTNYGLVQVCEDGKIRRVISTEEFPFAEDGEVGHKIGTNVLYYLLNHPDRIIRKPRFTQEEVEDAKTIMRFLQTAYSIKRYKDNTLGVRSREQFLTNITNSLFPSLRPGQDVMLEDVI